MDEKEFLKKAQELGYSVVKKTEEKMGKFEQALIALFLLSIFFTIIAVIFTCLSFNADWPFYAADSTLSSLITLITVRVIQKNKKGGA